MEGRNLWSGGLAVFLAVSLLFSSGCALLLLGAGGTAGYLIRRGEEGESPTNKEIKVEEKRASSSEGKGVQE